MRPIVYSYRRLLAVELRQVTQAIVSVNCGNFELNQYSNTPST